ncbi:MAG: M15 family metallopeptidase [Clostridia bacterium]|nr:M15 family metallopeptidase [Clostridia bacterium]
MPKPKKNNISRILILSLFFVALIAASFAFGYKTGYDKGADSASRNRNILLVNEDNLLPPDYVPEDLVNLYEMRHAFRLANAEIYMTRVAYEPMQEMFLAAEHDNVNGFIITSGYRSYERQQEIYAESKPGYAQKPGASEHQTGLCFDVTAMNSGDGFENTEQYAWLRQNAYKYGFIQRYPANKSHITGISHEPWHYRYVGVAAAEYIHKNNITLEEYLK